MIALKLNTKGSKMGKSELVTDTRDPRTTSTYQIAKDALIATEAFCYWCGRYVSPEFRTAEHLMGVEESGGWSTLRMACVKCNVGRATQHKVGKITLPDGTSVRTERRIATLLAPPVETWKPWVRIEVYSDYMMAKFRFANHKPGEELFAADYQRAVVLSNQLVDRLDAVHPEHRRWVEEWCVQQGRDLSFISPGRTLSEPELRSIAKNLILDHLGEVEFASRSDLRLLASDNHMGSVLGWLKKRTGEKQPGAAKLDELLGELAGQGLVEPMDWAKTYGGGCVWALKGKCSGARTKEGRLWSEVQAELLPATKDMIIAFLGEVREASKTKIKQLKNEDCSVKKWVRAAGEGDFQKGMGELDALLGEWASEGLIELSPSGRWRLASRKQLNLAPDGVPYIERAERSRAAAERMIFDYLDVVGAATKAEIGRLREPLGFTMWKWANYASKGGLGGGSEIRAVDWLLEDMRGAGKLAVVHFYGHEYWKEAGLNCLF